MKKRFSSHCPLVLFAIMIAIVTASGPAFAQTNAEINEATNKAATLLDQGSFREAVPYLQTLLKAKPDDADLHATYGLALLLGSKQTDNAAEAKKMSDAALVELQTAKKLGSKVQAVDNAIAILTGNDGKETETASPADKFFRQAEAYFAQSNYDEAIKFYQKALEAVRV